MATDQSTASAFTKATETMLKMNKELNSAVVGVENFKKTLTNFGIKKLEDQMKSALKASKKFDDATLDQVKGVEKLSKLFAVLEESVDDVIDSNTREIKSRRQILKENQEFQSRLALLTQALKDAQKNHGKASQEYKDAADEIKRSTAIFNQNTAAKIEEAKAVKKITDQFAGLDDKLTFSQKLIKSWNEHIESSKGKIASFAIGAFSANKAINNLSEGVKGVYQELVGISNAGLGGAYAQIKMASKKMVMSLTDMQEAINRNRASINLLGGGQGGIKKFIDIIDENRQELKNMLGEEGSSKAVINFTEAITTAGIGINDSKFKSVLKETTEGFKNVNALFGDTAEQYAAQMKELLKNENIQRRMNGLTAEGIRTQIKEIQVRNEQLRILGLSNTQIQEFNRKIEDIADPRKANVTKRFEESIRMQAADNMLAGRLREQGNLEDAQKLESNKSIYQEGYRLARQSPAKLKEFMTQNAEAYKLRSQAEAKAENTDSDRGNPFAGIAYNNVMNSAGSIGELMRNFGDQTATAARTGQNIQNPNGTQATPAYIEELKQAAKTQLQQSSTEFANIRGIVEKAMNLLNDPITKLGLGIIGLAGGLLLLLPAIVAQTAAVVANTAALGGKALGSILDKIPGKNKLGILAKGAGLAGAALDVGFGINDLLDGKKQDTLEGLDYINPMRLGMYAGNKINNGIETLTGGQSLGSKIYDWTHPSSNKDLVSLPKNAPATSASNSYSNEGRLSLPKNAPATSASNSAIIAKTANAKNNEIIMSNALDNAGFTDPKQKALLMAQLAHESGGFKYSAELGDANYFKKYDGREDLGNTQAGDGAKYKGRGFIQLTGRDNYAKAGAALGLPLLDQPELAEQPEIAAKIAVWYLNSRKNKQGQSVADVAATGNIESVSAMINGRNKKTGRANGIEDRIAKTNTYLASYSNGSTINSSPMTDAMVAMNGNSNGVNLPGNILSDGSLLTENQKQTQYLSIIASNMSTGKTINNSSGKTASVLPSSQVVGEKQA